MRKLLRWTFLILLLTMSLAGCQTTSALSPKDPVTLSLWHVYGEQADSPMNLLVEEFNETIGKEHGILINITLMSNSFKISESLLESQADTPGSLEMPDLFFGSASTANTLGIEHLLDWKEYFSEQELSHYVEGFLLDGTLDEKLVVFPVSKSSYALYLNGTQWERFLADTGVTSDMLSDWDGFFDVAAAYYDWSGGKPFCAFDYLIRHIELDVLANNGTLYTEDGWYDFTSQSLKESWMPFARALAQGHIVVSDQYANTQVMTGETLAGLGSTAAILYYKDTVTYPDNTSEPTDLQILPIPKTAGKEGLMPQTGVGLCAVKTTDQKAEAASLFIHWLTESDRNLKFVADTGYMPVTHEAFEAIEDYPFPTESYARLYEAMKHMRDQYTPVVRPPYDDFYDRVDTLYTSIRQIQPQLKERSDHGEDPALLAEEIWELFRSIQ